MHMNRILDVPAVILVCVQCCVDLLVPMIRSHIKYSPGTKHLNSIAISMNCHVVYLSNAMKNNSKV